MDTEQLPQRGTLWRTARGSLGLWRPFPSLLITALRDHGDAEFVAPMMAAYESLPQGSIHLFIDAEHVTSYDSSFRTELTARVAGDRQRIASFHILVKSRLVSMGVSVANLALGGIISTTADRRQFTVKLDSFLFDHRVVGFSSNVLNAVTPPGSSES